ncbi:glutamate 5-kinase [Allocoprobacillus halotolerans]|uniref:Glutamate 5-kinase n=1 Tax=Allocoprobacillus halotolerans TaxID=2944914 RepID=A0ABY5I2U3_9FIRM|nr:glutamate 5-kinase [Allocoprobacillus halotolerans]UTY38297.1 glutamate 5-kinase [Allocoprobacillus halotolerans]
MRKTKNIKRVIIKVGSSSLCHQDGYIDQQKILYLVMQVAKLIEQGMTVVIVSSGAISAGMGAMELPRKPETLPQKQALAAIGQAKLMQIYEEIFQLFHLKCSQVLLNHGDFDDRQRLLNLSHTMNALIDYGVIPIVNENDALAVEEIRVGDNDTLSALLVPVIDADLLILVSDIDGLYTDNPHVNPQAKLLKYVEHIDEKIEKMASGSTSKLGTGGMATKIKAAKIVNDYGKDMVIVNGQKANSILHVFDEHESGTWFNGGSGQNLKAKAHWLTYRSHSKGKIIVDDGACLALKAHKSLLPSGIVDVKGQFLAGQVVDVVSQKGQRIAKGIVQYSSLEIIMIKGHQSYEIKHILDRHDYDEVIHVNNMVILGGDTNE